MTRRSLAERGAAALGKAQAHRGEFPHGELGAERKLIADRALMALGREEQARRRAKGDQFGAAGATNSSNDAGAEASGGPEGRRETSGRR